MNRVLLTAATVGLHGRFRTARREARSLQEKWSDLPLPVEFVHPVWEEGREQLRKLVRQGLPADFLSLQFVRHLLYRTGFGELEQIELDYVERTEPSLRRAVIDYQEPWIGGPVSDSRPPVRGSVCSLNKLYYFVRIAEFVSLTRVQTIIDFGGGYGLMCHILQELVRPRPTVVIVDLPESLALQYAFLRTASSAPVVAHTVTPKGFEPGAAHLLPVQLLADEDVSCDLFISTFALSETPPELQRLIADRKFLGATSLYLTGQNVTAELWDQYRFESMEQIVEVARRTYARVRLEPFPVVSAWELTATEPHPATA